MHRYRLEESCRRIRRPPNRYKRQNHTDHTLEIQKDVRRREDNQGQHAVPEYAHCIVKKDVLVLQRSEPRTGGEGVKFANLAEEIHQHVNAKAAG